MAYNLSASGLRIEIVSLPTHPYGFTVTAYTDDADPFDVSQLSLADFKMGVNGDLILIHKPAGIELTINVIPGSDDDKALETLLDANRVAKNKVSYQDVITMTIVYPDGMTKVLNNGAIIGGTPLTGVSSQGKLKTKSYRFVFEGKIV